MKAKRKKPFAGNLASRKWLEEQGWTVATVEQTIPHTFIKRDCFGMADLLAMKDHDPAVWPFILSGGILLVQATAGGNFSSRKKAVLANPNLQLWLDAGGRFQIHDWRILAGHKRRQLRCEELERSCSNSDISENVAAEKR